MYQNTSLLRKEPFLLRKKLWYTYKPVKGTWFHVSKYKSAEKGTTSHTFDIYVLQPNDYNF